MRDVDGIKIMLRQPFTTEISHLSSCITDVITYGNCEIMSIILNDGKIDPSFMDNIALIDAIHLNRMDIFNVLIRDIRVDVSARNNWAMKWSIKNNRTDLVSILSRHPRVIETFDQKKVEKYFATIDNKHE